MKRIKLLRLIKAAAEGRIIETPCEVGDSIVWNEGGNVTLKAVEGFRIDGDGIGLRLITQEKSPSVKCKNISGYIRKRW